MTTDARSTVLPPEPPWWRLVTWLSWRSAAWLVEAITGLPRAARRRLSRRSTRPPASAPRRAPSPIATPRTPSFVEAVLAGLRARQTQPLPEPSIDERPTEVAVKRPG